MARRVVASVRMRKIERKTDETLERLHARRRKLRESFDARKAAAAASKRYQASEEFKGELPMTDTSRPVRPQPQKRPEEPAPAKAEPGEGSEHIQRLLRAKRKAADKDQGEKTRE